jgi:uncharacterized membrane protein (DUF373 family)
MENKHHAPRKFFAETRERWPIMSVYERFEQLVAIVLSLVISVVVALALVQLVVRVALRRSSIIQVKTVVLIALIALSRKFVILDSSATAASTIAALAGATFVLGVSTGCCASVMTASPRRRIESCAL